MARPAQTWAWFLPALAAAVLLVLLSKGGGNRRGGPAAAAESERRAPAGDLDLTSGRTRDAAAPEAPAAGQEKARVTMAAPEPAAKPPVRPFRGQVVDAATGEPIPELRVQAGALSAATDAQGRFAGAGFLPPELEHVEFYDDFNHSHVRTIRQEQLEPLPGDPGWLARIAVGPTFRFRVPGAGSVAEWRAALTWSAFERATRRHPWLPVRAVDPLWCRYDNPVKDAGAARGFRLDVESADGRYGGSAALSTVRGIHPEILTIAVEAFTVVEGRVMDAAGQGVAGVLVLAVPAAGNASPADPEGWSQQTTDREGRYQLRRLRPGRHWLSARPASGLRALVQELELPPGLSRAPDFVLPWTPAAGAIRGRLASRSGAELDDALLRLRAADGRDHSQVLKVDPVSARLLPYYARLRELQVEETATFEFSDLPPGEYELSVLAMDGWTWSPASIRVSPPAADLVFTREDAEPLRELVFHVSDAASGAEIPEFYVQFRSDQHWFPGAVPAAGGQTAGRVRPGARWRWNLHAAGYALASGDQDDFQEEGDRLVARVSLERGFGARFLLRDCQKQLGTFDTLGWQAFLEVDERPPVSGAELWVDGRLAGRSDGAGVIEIELEREPERCEIRAPGWRVLGSEHFQDGRILGPPREVLVWLVAM